MTKGAGVTLATEPLYGDYEVKTGNYIGEAWRIFKDYPGVFIGAALILAFVSIALSSIPFLGTLISIIVIPPLTGGYYYMALKASLGEKPEIGDLQKGFDYIVPLVVYSIASGIIISLGFLLLIVPGIYLAVGYVFAQLLIIDKDMDFWDAMETSRKVVTKNWFSIFVLLLAVLGITILGVLALGIGLLVALPLGIIISAVAYKDIFLNQLVAVPAEEPQA